MAATRREFLKTGVIAGAGLALPGLAFAGEGSSDAERAAMEAGGFSPESAGPGLEMPAGTFSRGVGMYPGNPAEDFGPEMVPDTSGAVRNLALRRPAYGSSSYDYNLTPQLITDGIAETRLPTWMTTVVNGQILPKPEREIVVDHFPAALIELPGRSPSVEVHLGGGEAVPEIDRIGIFVVVPQSADPATLLFSVSVSEDGHAWTKVGSAPGGQPLAPENYPPDMTRGSHVLSTPVMFDQPRKSRFYRVDLGTTQRVTAAAGTANAGTPEAAMATPMGFLSWRLGQIEFYHGGERVQIGGPYDFTSAWKSAGLDEEWVYVDLGGKFSLNRVMLHWIARAAEGKLQVSDDAVNWRDLRDLPMGPITDGQGLVADMRLETPGEGRYVRVLMTRPATENGYILSEMEVFGTGGFVARPKAAPAPKADGRLDLAGGAWKLHRVGHDEQGLQGEAIAAAGFQDADWLPATVPGTVLTSYLNLEAIPDPNYGQNQLQVSDSYFYSDFWYRTEFVAPAAKGGELQWMNLDGINWKAEVFLNGAKLGRVDGGFMRGRFDVTGKLLAGKPNALAIRILKNATPGSCKQKTLESASKNGGALGADNPTYHASIGWDWIPTIRGRNTGIWSDVYLTTTGAVTLEDPLVTSVLPLPDVSRADVSVEVFAVNHSAKPVSGVLRGRFGTLAFEQKLTLAANERQVVKLTPATHKQLRIEKPELWWPVGYGEPHLYDVEMRFEGRGTHDGGTHDRKAFKAGIRQMTANEDGGILHLFVNGRRFVARGGNWGFGESMLRFRAREYDACVRYHREMTLTMVRNWVGQIGDEAFYEACDRHGVMVWQDFWLANPWDGPIPEDNALFLANARDFVSRIRRHASIGIYCGRNEWYPPAPLQAGIKQLLAELHPDIHYIGSSADGPVSGHGPYRALPPAEYFRSADKKLHSEIGAPAIPPMESVRAMMPERALWPLSLDYGLHDFTLNGAQGGEAFRTLVDEAYGGATNAEDWVALGEMVSYEAYRAMFEAQSKYRMGILLWMSHPCWPSFVWQTYDFYMEPGAAYWGSKKGAEALHIQWNALTEAVEVVNYSAGKVTGLTAEVEIVNMDGTSAGKKQATLESAEDSTAMPIQMESPGGYPSGLSPVHFLRLTLTQGGTVRSRNFYLRGVEQGDYRAIRTLGKANVTAETTTAQRGGRWFLTTKLMNGSKVPALSVKLKAVRATSGDRILPAIYEDGFFALMPGESRTLQTELAEADTRGEMPKILVEGFNVARG